VLTDLTQLTGHGRLLPYGLVLIAAVVEREIAFIGAAALVAQGQLSAAGVLVSGALGAAIGDQAFFYAFRGRLPRWLARYPSLQRRAAPLVGRVRRHDAFMILLIRFAPGLRVAIAAAGAAVDVSALKFSLLNLLSAFVWACALLVLVGWFGPACLAQFGLGVWRGALAIGLVAFGSLKALGWYERRALAGADSI
jgi:membrane protein DedA with SNARE-associated domain